MREFYPDGKWEFNEAVANDFPKMLQRSIPELNALRALIVRIAQLRGANRILELGCSDGQMMQELLEAEILQVIGIDNSAAMIEQADDYLRDFYEAGRADVLHDDITTVESFGNFDLTLCILTLQFVPIGNRLPLLKKISGPLILVEKVLAPTFFTEVYHDFKTKNGYSKEEIKEKDEALQGVLVPLAPEWTEELLSQAGFTTITCFWRWMNFVGWIAEK